MTGEGGEGSLQTGASDVRNKIVSVWLSPSHCHSKDFTASLNNLCSQFAHIGSGAHPSG